MTTTTVPPIPFSINPEGLETLAGPGFDPSSLALVTAALPALTYAERVIWAAAGIKRCSSFEYGTDVLAGRVTEDQVLGLLGCLGLTYREKDEAYPEPTVQARGWAIDSGVSYLEQPYRVKDAEYARWFDYPQCCVEGYRQYADAWLDRLLGAFPFGQCTDAEALDGYVYPGGRREPERFSRMISHLKEVIGQHPEMKVSRGDLIAPLRRSMDELYDDPSYHLLLHFCMPLHDPACQAFRAKASAMYGALEAVGGKGYADFVAARSIFLDEHGECF